MNEIVLLDGAIGQELMQRSMEAATPLWATKVMLNHPEMVEGVHLDYFSAGSTVATTNTYSTLHDRLKKANLEGKINELWDAAINSAVSACTKHGSGKVAGSIGPLFGSYRPEICPPAAESARQYTDIVAKLVPEVDLLLLETMSSVEQAKGALMAATAAAHASNKPVWLAMTVDDFDGRKLRSGEALADVQPLLSEFNVDAILINCSRPEAASEGVSVISQFGKPFGAYANGFTKVPASYLKDGATVDVIEQRKDLGPKEYATFAMRWVSQGASIVGGCCGISPDHILELATQLRDAGYTIV